MCGYFFVLYWFRIAACTNSGAITEMLCAGQSFDITTQLSCTAYSVLLSNKTRIDTVFTLRHEAMPCPYVIAMTDRTHKQTYLHTGKTIYKKRQ